MRLNEDTVPSDCSEPIPLIYLEDGLDQATCDYLHINENGLIFESPWLFEPMKRIAIQLRSPDHGWQNEQMTCESVVVHSHACGTKRYQTTLLFSDRIN